MRGLVDFWLAHRHRELLREASQARLARELRRARKAGAADLRASDADASAMARTDVRQGLAEDAPRIAELLELNGAPRWVAFEEQFIVAEKAGKLLAVLRFRVGPERLDLGLLVTDPWAEERALAVALYAEALVMARSLGSREVRARTRRHETYPRDAGYRRCSGGWLLEVTDAPR